jgi:hypothetical protein
MEKAHLASRRKHTPEEIEQRRRGNLGRKRSPETLERMSKALRGRVFSPEHIEKLRQASLRWWDSKRQEDQE